MPELAFFRHGEELLRVTLTDRTALGSGPECDVSLPDPALARVQAVVERRADGWWLVDRSGAGTAVGGAPVREARLGDGADLALGAWRALFRAAEGVAPGAGETRLRAHDEPPAGAPPPARLRLRAGGRERTVPVTAAGVVVGKDPTCDAPLDDAFVSARHLRVEARGGRWALVDLGSTNGTFISGARVTRAELPFGLPVQLGDAEIVLEPREAPEPARAEAFEGMISRDAAMRQAFELVERVGPSEAAVTILGETGTGKELFARALHARSARRDGPFIPVNCSAIAETLIESELFGHEKGAFSGAERMRKGAFEEADRGTLFLDEIGELPLDLQPKLLRVLELGEVKRVGASRPIQVSVRIVAATHRDLRAQVRAGRFREDLFYRLCVVPITVPPLRRRAGDVRALAETFLARAAPRGVALRWSEEALAKLEAYDWPGNVRQLRNVVQRALLFRGEGLAIGPAAVTFEDTRAAPADGGDDDTLYVRGLTLEEIEREAIRLSLRRNRGKRAAVVKELRIAKSTVMKRIGQWGLHDEGRPPGEAPDPEPDDEAEVA
ncbi:sigma54 specific transcriptional regulator, Fis family [Anaeromyxobacter dehalogenans 2CP-1]|uniref:Sigma54 specific transcriptional regulator, Fis family n=1 Tax=Anaeromyxobacter dehalogenans (strain ATCC BAA-258 / DSM 21875 / 2CP-1) TaxID=455488 RepID=B8J5E7_ANAD2|nr:sigma 54-interacting transcriptional regulator [Anaeromyxobacter dehalogenans]ACL66809.1 sigma54 specific transcriptional regulator, Fis family [Anaeromyxobacter dehalogenans 2CP-1]